MELALRSGVAGAIRYRDTAAAVWMVHLDPVTILTDT
jgi:hypothetical protein